MGVTLATVAPLVGQRSRHRIPPFRLHRPGTAAAALDAFWGAEGSAAFMAGGIDLVGRMKAGFDVEDVVHLGRLPGFAGIEAKETTLVLGAGVTHRALAEDRDVRRLAPSLAAAWAGVGNIRVRLKGTLGGNLMAGDAAYDAPIACLVLGARLGFAGRGDTVEWRPAETLCDGQPAGLLVRIALDGLGDRHLVLDRSLKPALQMALGVETRAGAVSRLRLAVATGYARPLVVTLDPGGRLAPAGLAAEAAGLATALVQQLPPQSDDWRASGAYRRRMLDVLTRRALARAAP